MVAAASLPPGSGVRATKEIATGVTSVHSASDERPRGASIRPGALVHL